MSSFIPYGRQWIDEEDVSAVIEVLRGDYLTTGPAVARFEKLLRERTNAGYAVAVNSGTSALHTAYFAAGLSPGDEIVTSPLTFVATANAALYLGATVKFVDVQSDTGNLDPNLLEEAANERTRLIVPIDYAGHPADYDEIRVFAEERGLTTVADAAHSLGATYRGREVGTLAGLSEVSFHPVKPITSAEGGAVLTDNAAFAERAARFRSHGIVRDPDRMQGDYEGPWYYEMQDLGFNYRLTDVQSALGASQLRKLDAYVARRREIAAAYNDAFADLEGLILPTVRDKVEPGWHLYVVRVAGDPALRRPFFEKLRELGLGVQLHYVPVHHHPFYRRLGYKRGTYPVAEDFAARAVSLPIYPKMTDDDLGNVVERVREATRVVLGT